MDEEKKGQSKETPPEDKDRGKSADASPDAAKPKPEDAAKPKNGAESKPEEAEPTPEAAKSKPAAKAPPAKPAAKPPVRKPVQRGPAYEDLEEDPLLNALKERFGDSISGQSFLGQNIYAVPVNVLYDAMLFLRDRREWNFDYLIDLTAVDYLGDELRFCLVYHLYSYPQGLLIRIKSRLAEGEYAPSVTSIWKTADWMEREAYDMFGIQFSGHPNPGRILLPDDWHGFPLRKDYDIKLQDQAWIKKHLRIRKVPD